MQRLFEMRSFRLGLGVALAIVTCGSVWLFAQPNRAQCQRMENNYVGAQRCRGCHESEYKVWKQSAHAKAFDVLPKNERNNTACLQCHSVGTAVHVQGVQCESCHGPGRFYSKPEVMVDSTLARSVGLKVPRGGRACLTCHKTSPKVRKFHYRSMWKKIAHGRKK